MQVTTFDLQHLAIMNGAVNRSTGSVTRCDARVNSQILDDGPDNIVATHPRSHFGSR